MSDSTGVRNLLLSWCRAIGRAACEFASRSERPHRCWGRRRRSGAAALEFAFVAPVFFIFVFGLIELGRMMMIQESLTNAAREGCRTAALATTTSSSKVEAAVRDYLDSVMSNASDAGKVRVSVPAGLATTASGTELAIWVDVDYADVSWLPLGYLGLNPTIAAQQIGKRE